MPFLRAGLLRRLGLDGDLETAYRAWHIQQGEEHDAMMLHMMQEFAHRSKGHGA